MTSLPDVLDIDAEIRRIIADAQRTGWSGAAVQSALGAIVNYTEQIDAAVQAAIQPAPTPTPTPTPTPPTFVLPVANGGVFGRTKWLPGSKGCDIFLPRGTAVVAPCDCKVEEVIGGTGLQGGAEIILATLDRAWAWRYRHVKANVTVGQAVMQGQVVAAILDPSLDQLGAIPQWAQQQAGGAFPDGWQHLDLSVDRGSDQFAPTGGGGGNTDACSWLQSLNYAGKLLARTPGPPDAGVGLEDAKVMMMPEGRRSEA